MPLYVGDYLADTSHLDATGHGVYLLFLMRCWTKGSLPPDRMQCMSIAHAMDEQSICIADAVLGEFFILDADGYHNKRIDQEREKACQAYEKRAGAANARWSKKGDDALHMHSTSNAPAKHMQPQPQPQSQPQPQEQQQITLPSVACPKPAKIADPAIETIYQAYPMKAAKIDALKAIEKALKTIEPAVLLEKVQLYATAVAEWPKEDRDQFTPMCATWMNKGRWTDDPETWKRKGKGLPGDQRFLFTHSDYENSKPLSSDVNR
jgi:uncharacterized protein YdaU (DUF1376 family)